MFKMLKKTHKTPKNILDYSSHLLNFGSYGFKILEDLRLTKTQLHSLERSLQKKIKSLIGLSNKYKIWKCFTLNKTLTKLSLESRMGKGKGAIYTEVLYLKPGSIIYEFQNINYRQIKEILFFIKKKISVKLILIKKK